jgi:hypothetical protein
MLDKVASSSKAAHRAGREGRDLFKCWNGSQAGASMAQSLRLGAAMRCEVRLVCETDCSHQKRFKILKEAPTKREKNPEKSMKMPSKSSENPEKSRREKSLLCRRLPFFSGD